MTSMPSSPDKPAIDPQSDGRPKIALNLGRFGRLRFLLTGRWYICKLIDGILLVQMGIRVYTAGRGCVFFAVFWCNCAFFPDCRIVAI